MKKLTSVLALFGVLSAIAPSWANASARTGEVRGDNRAIACGVSLQKDLNQTAQNTIPGRTRGASVGAR